MPPSYSIVFSIGIIATFIFHSFFNSQFYSVVSRDSKVDNFADFLLFFLLIIIKSGLQAEIRWSVCISKSHRSFCGSFSRTGTGLYIYNLLIWSNLNFLHISQWITLPTQSCLALYSFCANLLHSLIMWLMVSSLSPHSLHLLFCCILSIPTLIWLVLMALFCTAIWRDSVSLLKFIFLIHFQVLSCEMLFISRLKRSWSCFPCFCHSVIYRVVSIFSDGCNQSSFVFFYVVFKSLYGCVNAVFDAGKSSSSLFSWYMSTSSLGCNALCMVISFLVLWSICLSSSLVHLRKCPEYLTRGTAQAFIPLIRFLLENFVSSIFLVLLRYSFWILFFISTYLMVSASKIPKYL